MAINRLTLDTVGSSGLPSGTCPCFLLTGIDYLALGPFLLGSPVRQATKGSDPRRFPLGLTERRENAQSHLHLQAVPRVLPFSRETRACWIIPLMLLLALTGLFIAAGQGAAPLLYTLF